jgi:hypothetical protein
MTFSTMNPCDPILFHQLPIIRKIIQDETWLEGERRGCCVPSDDRVVRDRVCEIVLRVGHQLRERVNALAQQQVTQDPPASNTTAEITRLPEPNDNEAA